MTSTIEYVRQPWNTRVGWDTAYKVYVGGVLRGWVLGYPRTPSRNAWMIQPSARWESIGPVATVYNTRKAATDALIEKTEPAS